jgi:hypothetical protein
VAIAGVEQEKREYEKAKKEYGHQEPSIEEANPNSRLQKAIAKKAARKKK